MSVASTLLNIAIQGITQAIDAINSLPGSDYEHEEWILAEVRDYLKEGLQDERSRSQTNSL